MNFNVCKTVLLSACLPTVCLAQQAPFSGIWSIDLRSTQERRQRVECGTATLELSQTGDRIVGNHYMATSKCGRLNEGGDGTVKGIVVGNTAVLVVTSGRNGAIVLGSAKLDRGVLVWQATEEIKAGEPAGDSPLILDKGSLIRSKN